MDSAGRMDILISKSHLACEQGKGRGEKGEKEIEKEKESL